MTNTKKYLTHPRPPLVYCVSITGQHAPVEGEPASGLNYSDNMITAIIKPWLLYTKKCIFVLILFNSVIGI